jgi:alpha-tubulin suppressor-like RCC1 family protein
MEPRTVAAGWKCSFFVDANGALLACGEENKPGLLGLQEGTSQGSFTAMVPTPVPSMAGVRIRAVVCHDDYSLVVSEAGQLSAWGPQLPPSPEGNGSWCRGLAPVPTIMEELRDHRVRQVVAGEYHCAALTEDGALFTWEIQDDTELDDPFPELGYGHGNFIPDRRGPYRVLALQGERITSVAGGAGFTVAVTKAGAVY